MRALFYTILARIRDCVRPAAGDADFEQELELHLAMAEEDKVRRGLSPEEARREARLELGGVTQLREAARAARGLPWLETFRLDGKLGLRMLRRSWGLTLVGGLAMAVTIGLGASIFNIWHTFAATTLPLDEGHRIVAIQPFDRAARRVDRSAPLSDFRRWRETLQSVEHVSAMRAISPAVIARDGVVGSVPAAEMTASGFQLARVQPLLGRPLTEEDEREGAEPVAVIGYQLWQSGYSSDPAVLGERIQIGDTPHVVIGVMPAGFRFPINQRLWTPLRTHPIGEGRPGSADVFVFARLVPGATLARAHAEVATFGLLPRDTAAGTTARLEPRVVPYAAGIFPDVHRNSWLAGVTLLLGVLLLIPPCANIAILVYARTVTRRDEFAVRTALGASRGRIVMQLFVEVLVLAGGAGFAGYLLARELSGWLTRAVMPTVGPGNLPFWMDLNPSLATILWVAGLSVLAAAIAGAIPAVRVTGRWRRAGVFGWGGRGAAGAGLGKTWTALLATQVALSLAILPSALEVMWGSFRPTVVALILGPGLPVEELLTASLVMAGDASRFDHLRIEAVRRLTSEAGVAGVTVSAARLFEEPSADIEVEGREVQDAEAHFNSIDGKFFEVFGARFLAGRNFATSDFASGRTPVIVNRSFITEVLGDPPAPELLRTSANALGRRIRYRDRESPAQRETPLVGRSEQREGGWYEIVGVVEDFPLSNNDPTIFHPMAVAPHPVTLTVRAPSGVLPVADRLREVTSGLDPRLRAGRLRSLEEMFWQRRSFDHMFGAMVGALTLIVLLFSMAGIYTLMAFTVAQRWREIGVRAALGAQPRRLLVGIFGRAAVPLLIGAVAGWALALWLHSSLPIAEAGGRSIPGIIPVSAAVMIVVGLLAVAGPARRAIRIDPTEALRVS